MRVLTPEVEARYRELYAQGCIACGTRRQIEVHHIVKRSNGGDDAPWNLLPLCHLHHTAGGIGVSWHAAPITFLDKFPNVRDHMITMGWEFGPYGKMFHPERNAK